jgi:nitrilase
MTSTTKETTVQVAVVQAAAVPFDTEACVDKAVHLIGEAAAGGAKVILFPEAFIPGYPKGLNHDLGVGVRL